MIILVGTLGKLNGSGYIKDEQLWLPQAIPGHEEGCMSIWADPQSTGGMAECYEILVWGPLL